MSLSVLEVAMLPGKGRGYKAVTNIAAGSVIHVSELLAAVVSQEWIPETCVWCFDFSYPKKQKVKALDEKENEELIKSWNIPSTKKSNINLAKGLLFCSENCKKSCEANGILLEMIAFNYCLELELKNTKQHEATIPELCHSHPVHAKWIDVNDDKALKIWLDNAWTVLTQNHDLYNEISDTDKTMCHLISACAISKDKDAASTLRYQGLLAIQNNELTHFRTHVNLNLYPDHPNQLPVTTDRDTYLDFLPSEVVEAMTLYSFFARTMNQVAYKVPTFSPIDHLTFREIFFRERSNSFGIWELGDEEITKSGGGVTNDVELLGWGIYPSAVYFNHSCDANVYKIRDGHTMKFVASRMIEKDEEACISYGSIQEDVQCRRQRLLEHYDFLCNCKRCIAEDFRENTPSR